MFLVYQIGQNVYAKNLDSVQMFAVQGTKVVDYYQSVTFGAYDTNEEAISRFNDAVEAAAAGQNIYDFRKDLGYWNKEEEPKKTTTKRAGRKPAAEKAPAEHHEPAPKK